MNAALLAIVLPIVKMLLGAFGSTFNDWLASKRAEQTNQDLGRVTAERDQETATRQATERELQASVNAPKTTDDAISRLEDGSA